ncbi:MAG: PAS domain-containing protein [Acidimicrobiia bacterium]
MAAPVAENRPLADLLDTLGRTADGMVAVDGDLRIVAWNEAATELLGFTEEEALLPNPEMRTRSWRPVK